MKGKLYRIGIVGFLTFTLAGFLLMAGERLYNGIQLPDVWPPAVEKLTDGPMEVPYLKHPPEVIPIDVGRQLFVDDFLIASTTLKRTFYSAKPYKNNPVLSADKLWEQTGRSPTAMVFSDGVWYDPTDQLFKMWYMCGYTVGVCYATSPDGLNWTKPSLDIEPGTNIVHQGPRNSTTVWLDSFATNPKERFKLFTAPNVPCKLEIHTSSDGLHWGPSIAESDPGNDPRSTAFFNPFRNVWVFSLRDSNIVNGTSRRMRLYKETRDLHHPVQKQHPPVLWIGADRLDHTYPGVDGVPQLYNLDAFPYESLMVGLISILQGVAPGRPKLNEVYLGFSRDGFHWDRTNRTPLLRVSNRSQDWNYGNVQSAGGGCLVVGDQLYFYHSGASGGPGNWEGGVGLTGLAFLRRDGFASMGTPTHGTLLTRPIVFQGKFLFVNFKAPDGELRVEILNKDGQAMAGFTQNVCRPLSGDSTIKRVQWGDIDNLTSLSHQPIRFRFFLRNGQLFSFWVSPDESGASNGYVAAGGPGFSGPIDTTGQTLGTKN